MKNIYLGLLCILLAAAPAFAQSKKKRKSAATLAYNKQNDENAKFLNKQWWLGAKGGINLSKPNVTTSYAVISPTNYTLANGTGKRYDSFKQMGSLATLEITFFLKEFSISFQPTYQHVSFTYRNEYEWISATNPNNLLQEKYVQEQKIDHFVLPLVAKYEITGNKLRPYLQLGLYTAMLINANKTVQRTRIDYASGGKSEIEEAPITVGAKDLFAKNHWGLIGGLGVYYKLGNVRLNLDAQYKYGQSNIASAKNRDNNVRLNGTGDTMDDLTLDNINISLGCLFPLRFLEDGFKSMNRKK